MQALCVYVKQISAWCYRIDWVWLAFLMLGVEDSAHDERVGLAKPLLGSIVAVFRPAKENYSCLLLY